MAHGISDQAVMGLCDAVMQGVAAAYNYDIPESHIDRACAIMRAEVKALLLDEGYADERACLLNHSLHDGYVIASVVASCVQKIGRLN